MVSCLHQVTADTKEILRQSVPREESLRLSRGCEPSPVALPLSGGLVRDFRPVVRIVAGVVNGTGHNSAVCGGITPQLVGHEPPGFASLTFQESTEEAVGDPLIATGLDQDVHSIPVLIDSSPEIMPLPLNG